MTTLRMALAQINPTAGDLGGNVEKILSGMETARKNHADIITFPELAICEYPPEDLLLKPGFVADWRGRSTRWQNEARGLPSSSVR